MPNLKRTPRQYGAEFKARAVKLYHTSEKSYKVLAKELGIPAATLSTWVHTTKHAIPKATKQANGASEDVQDLRCIKRELAVVKEGREILKKALAIFSLDAPVRYVVWGLGPDSLLPGRSVERSGRSTQHNPELIKN